MKLIKPLLFLILSVSLFALPSCKNKCRGVNCPSIATCDPETGACMINPCDTVNCGANGNCNPVNGSCACNTGYQGLHCDTMWSAKFVSGTGWAASDTTISSTAGTPAGVFTYVPTIADTLATVVTVGKMSGFADSKIKLLLTGPTDFTINDTDAAGRVYAGSGSISGNSIRVSYTVTFSDGTGDVIRARWTKN